MFGDVGPVVSVGKCGACAKPAFFIKISIAFDAVDIGAMKTEVPTRGLFGGWVWCWAWEEEFGF
jgi:hypothetical protein